LPPPISDLMARALAQPHLISLAAGFVDQATLPADEARAAFEAVWADGITARAALQYGTTAGYVPLREQILARHVGAGGPKISLDRVVVTAGSNQLLHLATEVLCDEGDIILCAAPTYFVFLGLLDGMGVRAVSVAADGEGIVPEALEARLTAIDAAGELARVKAIYVVTEFDNPSGATLSAARRPRLLEIARRWSKAGKIYLLEDAAYRELRYSGQTPATIWSLDAERGEQGGSVVFAGTFSKSFSPGVRVGWGILPAELVGPVVNFKGNVDFGSPNLNQHLMAAVLAGGRCEPHIMTLRARYRTKMEAMLAACRAHLADIPNVRWAAPEGGLYVWLELPPGVEAGPSGRLFDLAVNEGVLYVPGEYCFPAEGEPVRKNTIRLSFGVQPPERIEAGLAALARAIQRTKD
jgi:2-aminoadipate transaminase